MKKINLAIIIGVLLYGCAKDSNTPLDTKPILYQAASVAAFSSFTHTLTDSVIHPYIELTSAAGIKHVWIDIISPEGNSLTGNALSLYDNGEAASGDALKGDKIYSNLFIMKKDFLNGFYTINYFIENTGSEIKRLAVQSFLFDNGKTNVAPVILSVSAPDTITVVSAPLAFIVTATVSDSNGIKDVNEVYFTTIRPDQTSSGAKTSLYDDGNYTDHGDATAGDGVFSRALQIDSTNQKGTYRFDFTARDRGGLVSPTVNKYIVVK